MYKFTANSLNLTLLRNTDLLTINIDNEHRVSLCAVSVAAIKWSIFELQRQKTYAWKGLDALRIRIDFLNA